MNLPTKEQLDELLKEHDLKRAIELANPPPRMLHLQQTTRLSDWLVRCEKAGVTAIPATWGPSMKYEDITAALDGKSCPSCEEAQRWLVSELGAGEMWRFDCCAPYFLKSAMGQAGDKNGLGRPPIENLLEIDDPRFIDIAYDIGFQEIKICTRPWVAALITEEFPVEFRVYAFRVGDRYEYSASNYYPQRPLPQQFIKRAIESIALADKLANGCGDVFENGFSADFILQPSGKLLFLEGGPGWGFGSHPCCIAPDKMAPGRIVLVSEWDAC